MRRSSAFALVATAGIVAAVALASAPFAQAVLVPGLVRDSDPTPVQVRADCSTVLFLGARGSGQPASGGRDDAGTGLGPQVYQVAQRFAADLPGVSISALSVDYPAKEAQLLLLDSAAYFAGLETGVASVKRTLATQAATCPDQRIVLSGFSQGAMVMHRVLQDLAASRDAQSRSILTRLDGAILIADGDRLPRDRTTDDGSARGGHGISYALRGQSGVRGTRLPLRLKARVHSVCEKADIVCDFQSLVQANANGVDGGSIHVSAYTGSPHVMTATDAVAARLR